MRRALAALLLAAAGLAQAGPELSGQLRGVWTERVPSRDDGPQLSAELRASGGGLVAVGTLQSEHLEGRGWARRGVFNELYAAAPLGDWQLAAGKRIVGWDVGQGFRPNDVVQQERRRQLIATTAEGRPLLMAERFGADSALALVLVNPTHARSQRGAEEPALALRAYRREGAADLYAFARHGWRNGASLGAALAWVADESLELHASLRVIERADTLALAAAPGEVVRSDPWRPATTGRTAQALVGGSWTNAQQLSLLVEAWWDGAALSDAQWDGWAARNAALAALAGSPVPAEALAGNLAWQAGAFNAAQSLRRGNVYARLSARHGAFEPAVDLLWMPADGGRLVSATLGWQGDRWRFDAGARAALGPASSLARQLPVRRTLFAAATLAF